MSTIIRFSAFFLPLLAAFLLHLFPIFNPFIPQIIAFATIILILTLFFTKKLNLPLLVFIVNLIVFSTGAINSFLFFLIYFLLFSVSFTNSSTTNLLYSLITILFYSTSLDSYQSLIQLLSLVLITPISYLISLSQQEKKQAEVSLSRDQTDFMLWVSLHLKSSLRDIINISNQSEIRTIAKNLLKDSQYLEKTISDDSDQN